MLKRVSKRLLITILGLCLLVISSYANVPAPGIGNCPSCDQQADVHMGYCAGGADIPVASCVHHDYPHHHFRVYGAYWLECRHCGHRDSSAKVISYGPLLCRIQNWEDYYPHLGANVDIGKKYPISYFSR